MSITTKTGDQGTTSLYSGERVSKSDLRMMACGEMDELNSFMGWARVELHDDPELHALLIELQRTLFLMGSAAATAKEKHGKLDKIEPSHVDRINQIAEDFESRIDIPTDFILPGGSEAAARLDICRSITRRAERSFIRLLDEGILPASPASQWINRLSDLFWLLARYCEGNSVILRRENA